MKSKQYKKKLSLNVMHGHDNGLVLIAALALIAILAIVSTVAVITTTTDIKISGNYKSSVQAFYITEAGVERAKGVLKTNSFDKVLNGTHGGSPGILNFGTSTSFAGGTYTVRVFDDDNDGDGNILNDSNGMVKIIGTGTVSTGSTRTIEVMVSKADLDDFPAAVSMVDPDVKMEFRSDALSVTGIDTNYVPGPPEGTTPGTGTSKNGVASQGTTTATYSPQNAKDKITGVGTATPDIIGTTTPNLADLQAIRLKLIAMPGITTYSGPTSLGSVTTLGTRTNPQITYVNDSLDITGNVTGVGILIVDKELEVSGTFIFEGIILVGICLTCPGEFEGSGNSKIFGAVVVANHNGEAELEMEDTASIYYSTFAIDLALDATFAIVSWREVY